MEPAQPLHGRAKFYTIAQIAMSGLGSLFSLLAFFLLVGLAAWNFFIEPELLQQNNMLLVFGWTSLLVAVLFLPGLVTGIRRLQNLSDPRLPANTKHILYIILILIWLGSFLFALAGSTQEWAGMLTSVFVVPLVVIPLFFLIQIGSKDLSMGSSQRTWGTAGFSFFVSMPFILLLEIAIFAVIFIFIILWIMNQPALLEQIMAYSEQLSQFEMDPQIAEELFTSLFQNPSVLIGSILLLSVLGPVLEEFFKPMALWFLAGRKLTPSQGFVGGLISGACFAMLETLSAIGSPTDTSWLLLLTGRMGTGLLHITLSGLVGWGLASAFYNGNWGRFIWNYLSAVVLHGLWNLFALLSGIMPLLPFTEEIGNLPHILSQIGPYVLLFLAVANLYILFRSNRILRLQSNS